MESWSVICSREGTLHVSFMGPPGRGWYPGKEPPEASAPEGDVPARTLESIYRQSHKRNPYVRVREESPARDALTPQRKGLGSYFAETRMISVHFRESGIGVQDWVYKSEMNPCVLRQEDRKNWIALPPALDFMAIARAVIGKLDSLNPLC